ncbi:Thiopurine S-methyltransferase (TPMT) [Prauserella aidingensis]|uniref:class I SAM-dependent methyltransferase n=1 Tax=Prauserella aidingensis TaxID=387890 RepID=UPI0020A4FC1A|nr:class I SAM-dependent methyltransferase [Prauserella aidingensis]MCP2252573.1 Thiopurine S-methyltransferase (TPMT) [Prauserella aidingensis]
MSDADAVAEDRNRWNERYAARRPSFAPHPLVTEALAAGPPAGPVLELAGGRSGSALALAGQGRAVTVVDISDLALAQLRDEAARRGLGSRIDRVCADATATLTGEASAARWALVLATRFWDEAAFTAGAAAVAPGGLLAWEALRQHERGAEEEPPQPYRVPHGGLSERLPGGFTVLAERATDTTTRLLARAPA